MTQIQAHRLEENPRSSDDPNLNVHFMLYFDSLRTVHTSDIVLSFTSGGGYRHLLTSSWYHSVGTSNCYLLLGILVDFLVIQMYSLKKSCLCTIDGRSKTSQSMLQQTSTLTMFCLGSKKRA